MSAMKAFGNHFSEYLMHPWELIKFHDPARGEYVVHPPRQHHNIRNLVAFDVNSGPSSFRFQDTFEYTAPAAIPLRSQFEPLPNDGFGYSSYQDTRRHTW